MPVVAIVGAQWGDEGKGKVVDLLSTRAHVVARTQGGANAGHTIHRDGRKIILHLLPSGIFSPGTRCLVGPGVVLDPDEFARELQQIEELKVSIEDRLTVDLRTHVVFPTHKLIEQCQESALGGEKIGTTSRGIGPTYCDKTARRGVRVGDLLDNSRRPKICSDLFDYHATILEKIYEQNPPNRSELLKKTEEWADLLAPYAGDTVRLLHDAIHRKQTVLLEGAQGTFLDLDLGTYPFVTSSHPTVGGPIVGIGVPPQKIDFILGVLKGYCTRVGSGPFPTEMDETTADEVRQRGGEYGSTTGRPRRIGWLDLVIARDAAAWNGINGWAVTKLDVLTDFKPIRICSGYRSGAEVLPGVPASLQDWEGIEPVYEDMMGWDNGLEARNLKDLPLEARSYLKKIETSTGVPIYLISMGAGREATILPRGKIV